MTDYIERRRTCEAMPVTGDNAAEVAAWCGGMAMPDGSVLFKVGDVWLTASVGTYIVCERGHLSAVPVATFEADWEADEDA